jgi:glucose/arabinose dehydrogenase
LCLGPNRIHFGCLEEGRLGKDSGWQGERKFSSFRSLFSLFLVARAGRPVVGDRARKVEDRFLADGAGVKVEVWIENLEIPWSLVFLDRGRALVSKRPGRIRLTKEGKLVATPYAEVQVAHGGEGGMMGLALHLNFSERPYLYVMHPYEKGGHNYSTGW